MAATVPLIPARSNDPIDTAVGTQRVQVFNLKLQSGRLAQVAVPVDATDTELLEILTTIGMQIRPAVAANRIEAARPTLLVPVR